MGSSFKRRQMLMFAPLFFYSNFFYSYHFGIIGYLYNGRTASLVSAAYWIAQILGSFILQRFLDFDGMSKRSRGYASFILISLYMAATWTFGGYIQYSFHITNEKQGMDFRSSMQSPWASMLCLFLWGFVDSFIQVWSYWMMSQLSDVPEELACMTAFYKLWQNGGAFVSFLLSAFVPGFTPVVSYWLNVALIVGVILPTLSAIGRVPQLPKQELDRDVSDANSEDS